MVAGGPGKKPACGVVNGSDDLQLVGVVLGQGFDDIKNPLFKGCEAFLHKRPT